MIINLEESRRIVSHYVSHIEWCENLNEKSLCCEISDDFLRKINFGVTGGTNSLASGTATGPGF